MTTPRDHWPIQRILDNAIALLIRRGAFEGDLPFREKWARTADPSPEDPKCIMLGRTYSGGSSRCNVLQSNYARKDFGLLVCWEAV